ALEVSRSEKPDFRSHGFGDFGHLFMTVRLKIRKRRGERKLPVHKKTRTSGRAKQQAVFAGRQGKPGAGPKKKWPASIGLDAAIRVTRRHCEKAKRGLGISFAGRGHGESPTRLVGDALEDIDADGGRRLC